MGTLVWVGGGSNATIEAAAVEFGPGEVGWRTIIVLPSLPSNCNTTSTIYIARAFPSFWWSGVDVNLCRWVFECVKRGVTVYFQLLRGAAAVFY